MDSHVLLFSYVGSNQKLPINIPNLEFKELLPWIIPGKKRRVYQMYSAAVNAHIRDLIEQVMEYRDQGQWQKLEQLFTETPYIDEEVFNQEKPGIKTVTNVTYGWRRLIRDLYYSAKHTLGAMTIERTGKKEVSAETEVEARYYTMKDGQRHVFKMNGTYEYEFKKVAGRWKIDSLRLKVNQKSFSPIGV